MHIFVMANCTFVLYYHHTTELQKIGQTLKLILGKLRLQQNNLIFKLLVISICQQIYSSRLHNFSQTFQVERDTPSAE